MENKIIVIGAGLTGLTTAYRLKKAGQQVCVLEKSTRVGGQIHSYNEKGFIFESGPNTGVVSHPEVAELFNDLETESDCRLETAHEEAKRRLIWKGNQFVELPSGLASAISTPLFRFSDKLRILGEPFRAKGTNPDESVGELAKRRLGKSFVDYAVDPFIGGVYAGNPYKLITRYALPKLYNLEQNYGSFVKGAIQKAKEQKNDRDKLASKKVFSAVNGLENMVQSMAKFIGRESIILSALDLRVKPESNGLWSVIYTKDGITQTRQASTIITTCGAYALPSILDFLPKELSTDVSDLLYAPIIQASVGFRDTGSLKFNAFGGLVPSCESREVLGILFPSCCFDNRAPQGGALFSFFIGGARNPEYMEYSDNQLVELIERNIHSMLKFPRSSNPEFIRIFHHKKAIPQYELSTEKRLKAIDTIERNYPNLIIGGNLKNGIGMADRILQGYNMALRVK